MTVLSIWFCNHKWIAYAKKYYRWTEFSSTAPKGIVTYTQVNEILICSECGKIKKITY